jgi:hypothetical protein
MSRFPFIPKVQVYYFTVDMLKDVLSLELVRSNAKIKRNEVNYNMKIAKIRRKFCVIAKLIQNSFYVTKGP